MDLVSIVVPCYNVAPWLDDCVKSINAQTYKNVEAVFVDDGSTDDTLKVLKQLCEGHDNLHVFSQKNKGVSAARNAGLAKAKGQYVMFLDADDMLYPETVEIFHSYMIDGEGSDCVSSELIRVPEQTKFEGFSIKEKPNAKYYVDKTKMLKRFYKRKFGYGASNKMYRMEIIKTLPDYPHVFNEEMKYSEDFNFNFRYMVNCNRLAKLDITSYIYRNREGSAVHSPFKVYKLTSLIGLEEEEEYCKKYLPKMVKTVRSRKVTRRLGWLNQIAESGFTDESVINPLKEYVKANFKDLQNKFLMINYFFISRKINKNLRRAKCQNA